MMSPSRVLLSIALTVLVSSCATSRSEQELNYTASALTKVSAAVDATVQYMSVPHGASSAEILELSTSDDPALLAPFKGFQILARREGSFSEVLVCERDGSRALLEDAGCTAKLDRTHWRDNPHARCEFTLDLKSICAQ